MVDHAGGTADGSAVPTIAELLTSYRDRTGYSYKDMARKVRDEIQGSRLQQLVVAPPKAFPERRTIELLAELLEMPTATIVLACAAGMGIPVRDSSSELARTLPPGTDKLTVEDRDAIRTITRALIEARRDEMAIIQAWQQQQADRPPINSPEPARQFDYGLAARRGTPEKALMFRDVDAALEGPDPDPDAES